MQPREWHGLCNNPNTSYHALIQKMQVQFEALIIPYLPESPTFWTWAKAPQTIALRKRVFAEVDETVKQIKVEFHTDTDCHGRVTEVLRVVRPAISKIRALYEDSFSYFPFVFEFEMDDQIDIPKLTEKFNGQIAARIAKFNVKSGANSIPHYLIPDTDWLTVKSAIEVLEREKVKLLADASERANGDHREYRNHLNQIMRVFIKQLSLIHVSHIASYN